MPKDQIQKLSKEEVKRQLFDGLMIQIEPDLVFANREKTAKKLAKMAPEERKEAFNRYSEAYADFREAWPEYISICAKNIGDYTAKLKQESRRGEVRKMKLLESSFNTPSGE